MNLFSFLSISSIKTVPGLPHWIFHPVIMAKDQCRTFWHMVFCAVLYMQDIFQDIMMIFNAISSQISHNVTPSIIVQERSFAYAMILVFFISTLVVGYDTITKSNKLILVQEFPLIRLVIFVACLFNLGPICIEILKFFMQTKFVSRVYISRKETSHDLMLLERASSTSKAKEAVCENLPMLVIVCFKMALSSRVSIFELLSSASSALMFSKAVIGPMVKSINESAGFLKSTSIILFVATFLYSALELIIFFAIESERDLIFVGYIKESKVEQSAGLVFVLLILPTIILFLLPLTIYDFIPHLFVDSSMAWEHFLKTPKLIWYSPVLFITVAFIYSFSTVVYLVKRDPIYLFENLPTYLLDTSCSDEFLGKRLQKLLCGQWSLKVGAGRLHFKGFVICSGIIISLTYLLSLVFLIGMSYRPRDRFIRAHLKALDGEIHNLINEIMATNSLQTFSDLYQASVDKQLQLVTTIGDTHQGELIISYRIYVKNPRKTGC